MPPLVPRKRLRNTPPKDDKAPANKVLKSKAPQRKATLYDDLDASSTPQSLGNSHSILKGLNGDDSESSLTSLSDDEFEDVPLPKRQKVEDSGDEDDDVEFEDVGTPNVPSADGPRPTGDLELTLVKDTRISLINLYGDKKGPTKREKKVRNATHRLHVLTLMWHNAVRNSWLCDPEVQATMLSHLPRSMWDEVDRWKLKSGLETPESPKKSPKTKGRPKGKGKKKSDPEPKAEPDTARDWGGAADRLEKGVVDMSHGDPLFRLAQSLSAWWKKRFRITAPGLRKWGYMSLERLDRLTKSHQKNLIDPERFGETISGLQDFRRCARRGSGSRDVGAQLFTALLRGLGLEARMVANLQTLGYGWNRLEDADPEKETDETHGSPTTNGTSAAKKKQTNVRQGQSKTAQTSKSSRARPEKKSDPVIVVGSEDELDHEFKDTDDESVIEMEVVPKKTSGITKKYDADLEYPHYWTEVLSPITKRFLPVEPVVKHVVATNRELTESLEPRGGKADKARQIMAYIVGYSHDGTAKDITVRYLKRQVLPGRTKGARYPVEKVPVHNRNGRVKRYDQFDWFKTAMSGYTRGGRKNPTTDVDELEDSTDLKAAQPEKREVKEGEETLQYYKQSKEFALQRHFKREEALRPGAVSVKIFKNKAKGGKMEEEDVYLRTDVLQVKSAETWHKQGRAPVPGEQPLKRAPYRAATTNRRRELMEAELATGQKVLQGLFSEEQTDWIIPPPIENGVIPKNGYGNIDLFAEHMCPEGAIHVPYKGAIRVCKRMGIDHAEAVVGFEFGHRMAIPVIRGVVIAEEHYDDLMVELEKDEAERKRKEDEKRRKIALGKWRKFLMGMRIIERIQQDYGEVDEGVSVFGHSKGGLPAGTAPIKEPDEEMAGGFLPEGYEEEEEQPAYQNAGFFAPRAEEGDDANEYDGLVMDDGQAPDPDPKTTVNGEADGTADVNPQPMEDVVEDSTGEPTEVPLRRPRAKGRAATKQKPKAKPPAKPRGRPPRVKRKIVEDDEEESDSELSDLTSEYFEDN